MKQSLVLLNRSERDLRKRKLAMAKFGEKDPRISCMESKLEMAKISSQAFAHYIFHLKCLGVYPNGFLF